VVAREALGASERDAGRNNSLHFLGYNAAYLKQWQMGESVGIIRKNGILPVHWRRVGASSERRRTSDVRPGIIAIRCTALLDERNSTGRIKFRNSRPARPQCPGGTLWFNN